MIEEQADLEPGQHSYENARAAELGREGQYVMFQAPWARLSARQKWAWTVMSRPATDTHTWYDVGTQDGQDYAFAAS